jgi:hypothetical protein
MAEAGRKQPKSAHLTVSANSGRQRFESGRIRQRREGQKLRPKSLCRILRATARRAAIPHRPAPSLLQPCGAGLSPADPLSSESSRATVRIHGIPGRHQPGGHDR